MFAALRALRLRIAEKRGVPAYMIFNDATLRSMCAAVPQTPEQLLAVPGVGEAKLRAYGDEFLRAIASGRHRIKRESAAPVYERTRSYLSFCR